MEEAAADDNDDVFYLFLQKQKRGAELHIYLEEGTSWPTPHTIPFFLPLEDPYLVLLSHNSTPSWEPDPSPASLQRQQQSGTVHGRPERAPGRLRRATTPQPQRDYVEAV